MSSFQAAGNAGEVLVKRLEQLTPQTRDLLSAAALIGKTFELEMAAELIGMNSRVANRASQAIRRQRLIWLRPDGSSAFVHDRIRDACIGRIDEGRLPKMHRRIAEVISSRSDSDPFAVAFHFDAAGMHQKALEPALRAARNARQSFALQGAEEQLRIVERAFEDAESDVIYEACLQMAEVLLLQGKYDKVQPWLDLAETHTQDVFEQACIDSKRGDLEFKCGRKDKATSHLESSLKKLKHPTTRSRVSLFYQLGRELLTQVLHSCVPSVTQRSPKPSPNETLAIENYGQLAHAYWYTHGPFHTLWAHLRSMNLAERYADSLQLARSYSDHAPAMTMVRWLSRGIEYANRSLEIREQFSDVWGEGQTRNFMSIAYYSFARYEDCMQQSKRAIEIFGRTGDHWQMHIARYQYAGALLGQGKFAEAIEQCKLVYDSADENGDQQATGNIIELWARASRGQVPQSIIEIEMNRDVRDAQRSCQVFLAAAVCDYYRGDFHRALTRCERAVNEARVASIKNAYVSPSYAWRGTIIRRVLEHSGHRNRKYRRSMLKRLKKATWQALRFAKSFPNELPHALRERAAFMQMTGRSHRALRLFRQSLEAAKRLSMPIEHAETLYLMQSLSEDNPWEIDTETFQMAELTLQGVLATQDVNESSSLSLVDRFDSLLTAGLKISGCSQPDEIVDCVIEHAKQLLRSERVWVVSCDGDGPTAEERSVLTPQQLAVCETTIEAGETVLAESKDALEEQGTERTSLREGDWVCSPIKLHGTTARVLITQAEQKASVFGEDEKRISEYLGASAGAAFEKAEAFAAQQNINVRLEKQVAERTAEITERSDQLQRTADQLLRTKKDLQRSKEAAERANQSKSDFLARMSHEIRTPITGVLGFTELLLRGAAEDEQESLRYLSTIHSSGAHLLQLLNDLLDLSKIEADRLEVEELDCDWSRLANEVVLSMRSKAIEKNIDVTAEVEGVIPKTIQSDPTRLRQIITNLVGNAIKFTSKGHVRLVLSGESPKDTAASPEMQSGQGGQIKIRVIDTGTGMTDEQLQKIFDPFTQADTSTARKFGGTGLGLTISKRLTEALGGQLFVESTKDVGTVFTLHFGGRILDNAQWITEVQAKEHMNQVKARNYSDIDLSGVEILVADDSKINRDLLTHLLGKSGANVTTVCDGLELVSAVVNGAMKPDVVITDVQMPRMDGYEATRQLRAAAYQGPIMALTAGSLDGEEMKSREAGCDEYLAKPIDTDKLFASLAKLLDRSIVSVSGTAISDKPAKTLAADKSQGVFEGIDPMLQPFAFEFVEHLEECLPEINSAIEQDDLVRVATEMHRIKGTGGSVGLDAVSGFAERAEDAAKEKDHRELLGAIDEIQAFVKVALEEDLSAD
ncbi:MAG: ATP-binding protein [Planctomycetota bacterium]